MRKDVVAPERLRCPWAGNDPLYLAYHDREWGVPVTEDRLLFEFLLLEGAQAGLSWITILRKREGYRKTFAGFDPQEVARWGEERVEAILADPDAGIVRNRRKVRGALANARAFCAVQEEFGSFAAYLWRFVEGVPITNRWERNEDIPAVTPLAERLSKDLKARGFSFVGPTICYAHMQAVGMVNDHLVSCFRHAEVAALADGVARRLR